MFNIIHISKANFYPNYPYVTPLFWENYIIFRTWKHQHSQSRKFANSQLTSDHGAKKILENFKQQDSTFGLKQQYLGIQRTMSYRALTEAEGYNWNDKISFIFLKHTSNVAAMASDVNIDII